MALMKLLVEKREDEAGKLSTNQEVILEFIRVVWNQRCLERLGDFLHKEFVDYSIPVPLLQNRTGTRLYLGKLKSMLSHQTVVNKLVECDDLIICDFTLSWRSSGAAGGISGMRIFRMKSGKILHHWEVIH